MLHRSSKSWLWVNVVALTLVVGCAVDANDAIERLPGNTPEPVLMSVDPNWNEDICIPGTCTPWHSIECGWDFDSSPDNPCSDDEMWQKKRCFDASCNIYEKERCYYWRSECHI